MPTTIVVADDHQIVREGIRKLLETRSDFEVVGEASDGEQAVQLVFDRQPDIALMDIWMPRLSGIDATRRIGKGGSTTKVVMLSMHASREYVEETLRAGASGYIVKSAAAKDLLDAIDAVCSGVSYLSPAVTQQVVQAIARPADAPPSGIAALTDREREVLQLVATQDRGFAPVEPDAEAGHPQGRGPGPIRHPQRPRRALRLGSQRARRFGER
jgi:DNA-binding NarL/FixJ family response regulator